MTGYTVHTGSNKKFAAGWEQVFGTQRKAAASGAKPSTAKRTTQAKKKK